MSSCLGNWAVWHNRENYLSPYFCHLKNFGLDYIKQSLEMPFFLFSPISWRLGIRVPEIAGSGEHVVLEHPQHPTLSTSWACLPRSTADAGLLRQKGKKPGLAGPGSHVARQQALCPSPTWEAKEALANGTTLHRLAQPGTQMHWREMAGRRG